MSGRLSPLSAPFLLCDLPLRSIVFCHARPLTLSPLHRIYGSLRSRALLETKTLRLNTESSSVPDDSASTAGLNSVQTRSDHVTHDAITPKHFWRHRSAEVNRRESPSGRYGVAASTAGSCFRRRIQLQAREGRTGGRAKRTGDGEATASVGPIVVVVVDLFVLRCAFPCDLLTIDSRRHRSQSPLLLPVRDTLPGHFPLAAISWMRKLTNPVPN